MSDLAAEAERVAELARAGGVPLKLVGGLAVRALAPSSRSAPLARAYKDLDLALPFRARVDAIRLLTEAGYQENKPFNALNGHTRLMFLDPANERQVDVFVDKMQLCHTLDLRSRFEHPGPTIPPADLLLSKLQIVQITEKDLQDIVALLTDLPLEGPDGIDVAYLCGLAGADWGLWRTITGTLARTAAFIETELAGWEAGQGALQRTRQLRDALDAAPKTLRWKARALVGEKVQWYDLPEERA